MLNDLFRRSDALEYLDDDTIGREQARGAAAKRGFIEVDKRFDAAGKRRQVEEHYRIHDHAAGGFLARRKDIFTAGAEEQLISEELELVVENGLTGDELLEHDASIWYADLKSESQGERMATRFERRTCGKGCQV